MKPRLFLLCCLLVFCYISNPAVDNLRGNSYLKRKGIVTNYALFSTLYHPASPLVLRETLYLGVAWTWIPIYPSALFKSWCSYCRNGWCLLGECVCLMGWRGKNCSIKQADFVSLWKGYILPLLLRISQAVGWSRSALWEYSALDCVLGIPNQLVPQTLLPVLQWLGWQNLGTKLTALDLVLALLVAGGLWPKAHQLGLLARPMRSRWVDLSWYNVQVRREYAPILLAPFWHPHVLPWVTNLYGFYTMAPYCLGILGHNVFLLYVLMQLAACSCISIWVASQTNQRQRVFYGLASLITAFKLLVLFDSWDKRQTFQSLLLPHFVALFLSSGGHVDWAGIVCGGGLSFVFYHWPYRFAL
ncbi:hypothetical protein HDV03_002400 [Kappamyces sp. JEL0829]|nr:hypothetical protein HDV03_002400 [Kappamyces sp. JEL0829]